MAETTTAGPFNPNANVASPGYYLHYFKPAGEGLSLPDAFGTALKGLGDVIGTVTQGVDAIIKSNVTGDVEKEVEPQRKQQISDLEATYGTQAVSQLLKPGEKTPGMVAAANAPTQTMGGAPQFPAPEYSELAPSLTGMDRKLPKDINDLPGRINAIYNARNDGHVSDTYYWGRLSDIASDIRSRYPRGYRNYIDSKIQEVTGRDPANAYIESMIRDINTNLGDKNKDRDKLTAELLQGNIIGRPGAQEMLNGLMSGRKSSEEVVNWLAASKKDDATADIAKRNYEFDKNNNVAAGDRAARYANVIAPQIVNQYFRGMKTVNGDQVINISTPEDLNRLASEYKQGRAPMDKKVAIALGTQVSAWKQAASDAMDEDFQKMGVYKDMANEPQKLKQIKDLHLERLTQLQEAFFKGDVSAAANITNMNEAANDDFAYKVYSQKDLGAQTLLLKFLKNTMGDQGAAALIEREPFKDLTNSWSQKGKAIMGQMMTPDDVFKQVGGKDYTSLAASIKAINTGAAEEGMKTSHPQVIKTYNQLFSMIEDGLADKDIKPETKAELFKSIFGEDNRGVLRQIAPDRQDPNNPSKMIPGYQSLFYRLTRADIAQAAHDLGPAYTGMYLNWIQTSVREDLFRPELTKLGEQLNALKGFYSVQWDTTSKSLKIKVENQDLAEAATRGLSARGGYGGDLPSLLNTQSSLNKGLMGMANAARGLGLQGDDVDGFVLEQLVSAGVPGVDRIGGMPTKVKDAISKAYTEQTNRMEDAKQKQLERDKMYLGPEPVSEQTRPVTPAVVPQPESTPLQPGTVKTIPFRRPANPMPPVGPVTVAPKFPSPLPPASLGPEGP